MLLRRVAMLNGTLPRAAALALFFAAIAAAAATFAENVDPNNDMSQYAWGENVGWINAEPSGEGGPGVTVSGTDVTGYMWGENIGWINMSCLNNATCGTVEFGVVNDGLGNLTGHAWGENVGWIVFSCESTPDGCADEEFGVTIDPNTGIWSGFAWGENIGWISFSDAAPVAYKVQTDDGDAFPGSTDTCDFDFNVDNTNTDAASIPNPPNANDATIPNHDPFGDACDGDDDNDGFMDAEEALNPVCGTATGVTLPLNADTDGDRARDWFECQVGFNPNSAASKPPSIFGGGTDPDSDGLPTAFENAIGSDPNDNDSDNDGILDGIEVRGYSADPSVLDTDGDGCNDDTEITSIDGNKTTNVIDLQIIAGAVFTVRPVLDVTKNGSVDVIDLQVVASNITFVACP